MEVHHSRRTASAPLIIFQHPAQLYFLLIREILRRNQRRATAIAHRRQTAEGMMQEGKLPLVVNADHGGNVGQSFRRHGIRTSYKHMGVRPDSNFPYEI